MQIKKIDEIRNSLIEEINRNELMSKKPKKFCRSLNYIENSLILISTITRCISNTSSAIELIAEIKMYKSTNTKKYKYVKIVLLA